MGRNKERKSLAIKQGYKFTKKQLDKWGMKYDELLFGKPSFDIYIDDKNLNFKDNWPRLLKKIKNKKLINEINCNRRRVL